MGRLEVTIVECRNLPNVELLGVIDPYCQVQLDSHSAHTNDKVLKTPVIDNECNPKFNTTFVFQVADADSSQLKFSIWDKNMMSDTFLGSYQLSLSGLVRGQKQEKWYLLQQCKSNAEIKIALLAADFGSDSAHSASGKSQTATAPEPYYPPPPLVAQQPTYNAASHPDIYKPPTPPPTTTATIPPTQSSTVPPQTGGPHPSAKDSTVGSNVKHVENENHQGEADRADFRRRVERILRAYMPDKLSDVDQMLSKYKGKEAQLIDALTKKYGPEPTDANTVNPTHWPMQWTPSSLEIWLDGFAEADQNGSGTVSQREVRALFARKGIVDEAKIKDIFLRGDANRSGTLEFPEFVKAMVGGEVTEEMVHHFATLTPAKVHIAIRAVDTNKSGTLSNKEVARFFLGFGFKLDLNSLPHSMNTEQFLQYCKSFKKKH